jgi:16S rRNA processing protein RimM
LNSREEAEAINRVELFVDRSQLPDELEEDEFYLADLIALEVRDSAGQAIGSVKNCYNFGAGDLIEIAFEAPDEKGRKRVEILPFTRETIPNLNLNEGWVEFVMPIVVSERDGAEEVDGNSEEEAL